MHAPGRQDSVDIFEEEIVFQQRADGMVCSPPFDGPQVEVQAWPRKSLTGFEHRNAFGEARGELLDPFSQPLCRPPTWMP
jgi:hypothetical protein